MTFSPNSTAPHLHPASHWRQYSSDPSTLLLFESPNSHVEVGIRRFFPGITPLHFPLDHVAYVFAGRGQFQSVLGESTDTTPGTLIHFKQSWRGTLQSSEPLDVSYMSCDGAPSGKTSVLRDALTAAPLKDWGVIPTMIDGISRTAGILLSRDPDNHAESGIWTCTPGLWRCEVTSDEFCHFLEGSCTYTHDDGDVIHIEPDTLAFFPQGWSGHCQVRRTVRKVYLIR
jgi:uncharacterized cupin superfamily protein